MIWKTESTNIQSTSTLKVGKWDWIYLFCALHKNDCNKTLKAEEQVTQEHDKYSEYFSCFQMNGFQNDYQM